MVKYLSNYILYLQKRHCHTLVLIYGTRMWFSKFWPFHLLDIIISGMHSGYVQWKKTTGFTQTSCSLYLISISFTVVRLLTDFVCLYTYEFWHSLCKIVRSSVILLLPLLSSLLSLNKIPCLLYEQLFIYTTIWFKRNILLGSILSLSYYVLRSHVKAVLFFCNINLWQYDDNVIFSWRRRLFF